MKIALCHGYFSCLHYGHLEMFEYARSMSDLLYVSVARTSPLKSSPIPVGLRARLIKQLYMVDAVEIFDNGPQSILEVRPSFYVKGPTWKMDTPEKDRIAEISACAEVGCQIAFMKSWKKWTQASEEIKTP